MKDQVVFSIEAKTLADEIQKWSEEVLGYSNVTLRDGAKDTETNPYTNVEVEFLSIEDTNLFKLAFAGRFEGF